MRKKTEGKRWGAQMWVKCSWGQSTLSEPEQAGPSGTVHSRPTLSQAHRGELMGQKATGSGGDCGKWSRDRPKASPAHLGLAATQAQAQSDLTFQEMPEVKSLRDIPFSPNMLVQHLRE